MFTIARAVEALSVQHDQPQHWSVCGELASATAPLLVSALLSARDEGPTAYIHCSRVTFVDAVGWRTLRTTRQALSPDTELQLVDPSPAVAMAVQVLGSP